MALIKFERRMVDPYHENAFGAVKENCFFNSIHFLQVSRREFVVNEFFC